MPLPVDRESLLAAWDAIVPSQPLPDEVHGILLAYVRHAELQGDHTVGWIALPVQQTDQLSPPSRFVRQPRANTKTPPGPAEVEICTRREKASPGTFPFSVKSTQALCRGTSTAVDPRENNNH